jgi:pimeloyl-ACP methyl ester carboxylesterase
MVLFRTGNIEGVATLLADQPMFSAPPPRAELARRMVVENAGLLRQDPTQERRTQPPALTRLALVALPTLVIVGEKDNQDIRRAADTLAAVIPGARRVEMPGADHLLPLWDSDGFVRVLLDFLRP